MPRRARLLFPGYPLHIIQRAHNHAPCFFTRTDYLVYLHCLREASRFWGATIHAYVLMTNHVHLLASIDDVTMLSAWMKDIAQSYAQYLNRRLERSGSVWQERYKSSAITDDRYFLTCQRYIELNPVRAGMVPAPWNYRWSSYAGNAGLLEDEFISPHDVFVGLASDPGRRYAAYRALFADVIQDPQLQAIRQAARRNLPLSTL